VMATLGAVYCFMPDLIVRQTNDMAHGKPRLLHFALPVRWREGRVTAQQVRSTGIGLFLLSACFLIVAITTILGHH
jgi:hypothetical protein